MRFTTLTSAAVAIVAASAQSTNTTNTTLTSLIASNSNLTGLASLLTAYPAIAAQIANRTNVTLFAPSNAAISALNTSALSTMNMTAAITALLDYHILNGTYYSQNISSTPQFPHTNLNSPTYDNVTGGQVVECRLVNNQTVEIISGLRSIANVTQANLNFTGGVVHVIDSVLSIPGSFSSVAQSADLTALAGALNASSLTSTLNIAHEITVFAPSNSAFQNIGSANLTTAQLTNILEYHVLNGTVAYSSSLTNTTLKTLTGTNLNVTVANGEVFVNTARIVTPDILIAGGVLHVIDAVLNPNATANQTSVNVHETAAATAFSGVSSGSTVPFTSGQATPTSSIAALVSTQTNVASGYSSVVAAGGSAATSSASKAAASSTSSKKGAAAAVAAPTGVVGAAALFGGAFLANL